ncbi:alpha/beta hydrolase [Actinoplanes sp. N902-109]|uniref:alpha/beta hydrolase n=1 Tax=Actinoplanes sp. (strain N902-109) TaxID=649831 RepID=UPI000329575B|nr:alpha/beta hydrolase [Actinoplanes sp. N902-109]AGL15426.1 hypothetical protein L083_1916 [Actinoplanes sp. N902-109]
MTPGYVLVHSLLLGPATWAPVAARLTAAGAVVAVPSLVDVTDPDEPPFWPGVASRVAAAAPERPVVVVAHSNAGLMVPVIVDALGDRALGCVFVDSSLPSRVAPATPAASPERLEFLRSLPPGDRLPQWTTWFPDDDVAQLFPDAPTQAAVTAEQPRLPISYYAQQIPVPPGWDDRPCGYLWFGPPYDRTAADARDRAWRVEHLPGRHLHQLVDPAAVAARLLAMAGG